MKQLENHKGDIVKKQQNIKEIKIESFVEKGFKNNQKVYKSNLGSYSSNKSN